MDPLGAAPLPVAAAAAAAAAARIASSKSKDEDTETRVLKPGFQQTSAGRTRWAVRSDVPESHLRAACAGYNALTENRSVLSRLFPNATSSSSHLHGATSGTAKLRVDTRHGVVAAPPKSTDRSATTWSDRITQSNNNNNHAPPSRPTACFHSADPPKSAPPAPTVVGSSSHNSATKQQQLLTHAPETTREPESQDDVAILREQVTLLMKSLEDEKKRRILEQKLMQEKIIELQGLIRSDFPEHKKAQERRLVQMRSPSAARAKLRNGGSSGSKLVLVKPQLSRRSSKSSSSGGSSNSLASSGGTAPAHEEKKKNQCQCEHEGSLSSPGMLDREAATEIRMKKQLTKLRARMQTMVTDAQTESATLRTLLANEKLSHERKERQLRVEANAKLFAVEVLSNYFDFACKAENQMLADQLKEKDSRISQLELALGGKRIVVEATFANAAKEP